ncbi:tryptophan halogenase family protein [Pseudoalteromonas sp. SSDWG2]|uniref:tryptophan halogenase family protein n=1 Tax=Pseudoalteromonas sp. SSDWG2 TaxID=3139391 RepID=UPI003BAAB92C
MQEKPIRHVIILGGGTAGWLSANHLASKLKNSADGGVSVTLLESPDTPTVGVGEGTVPLMVHTLKEFGISETQFINECDVSFKQGIRFDSWMQASKGQEHYYYHPFDYPILDNNNLAAWLKERQHSFANQVGIQGQLCDQGLAPKTICCPEYQGLAAYGYHLDANKFAALLAHHATTKLGVEHQRVHVTDVQLDEEGAIKQLVDSNGALHHADLYIDCSGFASRLLGEAMKVPFIDKSEVLFVNKALAIQVPYSEPGMPLPSYTKATAQSAGWIWDIALPTRLGVGYVFSDTYTSVDDALHTLAGYLNRPVDEVNAREIDMPVGYREKFWLKNCVAIGLAQGFVEPLEATGLLVFDATAKLLAHQFPTTTSELDPLSRRFNQYVTGMWESVIDFIKLHYAISNRDDSDFWRDNRNPDTWPVQLKDNLAHWRTHLPSHYDFAKGFDAFRLENYLYVLYGMNYPTQIKDSPFNHCSKNHHALQSAIAAKASHVSKQLQLNRELIEKIQMNGLSKV